MMQRYASVLSRTEDHKSWSEDSNCLSGYTFGLAGARPEMGIVAS